MRYINRNRFVRGNTQVQPEINSEAGIVQLTNNSGGKLEYGDIVVIDKTAPLSVTMSNLYFSEDVIGVIKIGGMNGQLVSVQYAGIIDLKMTVYAVNIGDNIYTSNLNGQGYAYSYSWPGAFAKALTSKPYGAAGMVKAILSGGLPEVY